MNPDESYCLVDDDGDMWAFTPNTMTWQPAIVSGRTLVWDEDWDGVFEFEAWDILLAAEVAL